MKILVDGQTLGTPELRRGIGKFLLEILRRLIDGDPRHEWFIAVRSAADVDHINPTVRRFVSPVVLPPLSATGDQIEWCRAYGRQLEQLALSTRADVYWNPNPLMPNVHYPIGFTHCPVIVTLHDLIPRVMQEEYRPLLGEALWRDYLERLKEMARPSSWVVAVSKTSAADYRRFYPQHQCPIRVVYHASDYSRFWPYVQGDRLSDPQYVLYVGGFDPRKNMDNALRAYAAFVARPGRESVRFKVVCSYDEASRDRYIGLARVLGVADRVDLLGYVSDEELGFLFRGASIFFFPSVYEGFGLPVLDALACGVPVVASNTSSIPEVGGEYACYCDPASVPDMARALDREWQQRDPRGPSRQAAIAHARSFRWELAAKKYLDIFDEAHTSNRKSRRLNLSRRPRIAYLSPWPPQKSGVADYSYHLMPHLLARMDVTLFAENPHECLPVEGMQIRPLDDYAKCASTFENAIYHLGNGLTHIGIYENAWKEPGMIVLHDFNIHPFFHHGFLGHAREALYETAIKEYGPAGCAAWQHWLTTGDRPDVWKFPMSHPIARRSRATITHSRWVADQLDGIENVVRVHHGATRRPLVPCDEQRQLQERLSLSSDSYWIGVFGFVNRHKRVESILAAAKELLVKGYPVQVLVVGEINDDRIDIAAAAHRLGVAGILRHQGYVTESTFLEYMQAVDVVCNLRFPTMGESSGSMFHALAHGKCVLVSDHGAFAELPNRCVWKVNPLANEIEELSSGLETLLKNAPVRKAMSSNAVEFVSSSASLEHVAECYLRTIENSVPRGVEHSIRDSEPELRTMAVG
jgi:glycosyltransferase involved in cell wall biosynthesis